MNELSLACHQLTLALNYVLTLKSLPENPVYSCVFKPENVKLKSHKVTVKNSNSCRLYATPPREIQNESGTETDWWRLFFGHTPWILSAPIVQFDLTKLKKDMTNPETYNNFICDLLQAVLRSSSDKLLCVPRVNLKSTGARSFQYQVPYVWNSVPIQTQFSTSLTSFKSSLKTNLFHTAFTQVWNCHREHGWGGGGWGGAKHGTNMLLPALFHLLCHIVDVCGVWMWVCGRVYVRCGCAGVCVWNALVLMYALTVLVLFWLSWQYLCFSDSHVHIDVCIIL